MMGTMFSPADTFAREEAGIADRAMVSVVEMIVLENHGLCLEILLVLF
jgi:hypothetical protein